MNGTEIDLNNLSSYWKYRSMKVILPLLFQKGLKSIILIKTCLKKLKKRQNIILKNQLLKDGK